MNDGARTERLVTDALARAAPLRAPGRVRADIKATTCRARQRPRWLALIKEPPMRLSTRVAVGSPTARLASIALVTVFLAVMATGAVLAGASLLAGPGVIVVALDGSGDFTTITEALAAADDGDTILVEPGTYVESLRINEHITLAGDGPREDIVIAFTTDSPTVPIHVGWPVEQEVPFGVALEDSDATIAGITISGPSPGLAVRVDGGAPVIDAVTIVLDGDPNSIETNALAFYGASTPTVRGSTWSGYVGVREASAVHFESNSIKGGTVSLDGPGESTIVGNTLTGTATLNPSGARGSIEGNDITGGSILIDAISDLIIRSNTIRESDSGEGAIAVLDGSTVHLVGNSVTASGTALRLAADVHAIVEGTRLSDNQIGVMTDATDVSLVANEITGNRLGVVVYGGRPVLEGNIISGNEAGLIVGANGHPELAGNTICDNEANLTMSGAAETLDTAGNEVCPDTPSQSSE